MRGFALVILAFLVVAGCATPAPARLPVPPALGALPPLGDPLGLEPGELVARDATSAVFAWHAQFVGGELVWEPQTVREVGATEMRTILALPAESRLGVQTWLRWNGSADLDLIVESDQRHLCRSTSGDGDRFGSTAGEETCSAWPMPGDSSTWKVRVVAVEIGPQPVPFEVVVRVTTLPPPALYDITQGPHRPLDAPDATAPGPHKVVTTEYDLGVMMVEDRGTKRPYPVRLLGVAHFPQGDAGPLPLVVMMHGRHATCESEPVGVPVATSHCRFPAGPVRAVPSHRGYDEAAIVLASHAFAVVSIDANDVNALDSPPQTPSGDHGIDARAALLLRTLDEFQRVHAGGGGPLNAPLDALRGRLDLERIGLMGHSRGAEGVTRAPSYAQEQGHWSAQAFRGVYSLAGNIRPGLSDYVIPTIPPHVAYVSVLPYCDGDVWTLGNADVHDIAGASPQRGELTQILAMGANHNYYNSAWPQDDSDMMWRGDDYCAPGDVGYGRLSPEDQRRHQLVYLPAFFRLHLAGASAFAPLFTGEATAPQQACPEGGSTCPGLLHVSYRARAGDVLSIEDGAGAKEENDLGGVSGFEGATSVEVCMPRKAEGPCARPRALGSASRLRVAWDDAMVWRTALPGEDAASFDALSFRLGIDVPDEAPPGTPSPTLVVTLEDARGRRVSVDVAEHSAAVFVAPGGPARRIVLNEVRVPLDAFAGVDLKDVRAVELRFASATPMAAHLAELAFVRLGAR